MSKPSLSVALGVQRHARKKMADGGEVKSEPSAWDNIKSNILTGSSAQNVSWGNKACGGMVFDHKDLAKAVIKKMSGGGEVEPEDDFLSGDEDSEINSVGMPDDSDERADEMSSKGMLKGIMAKRRK